MSVGGQDLWGSLLWLGAFAVGAAAIVLIVVWVGKRRGSTTIALDAAESLSYVWLVLLAVSLVLSIAQASMTPFVSLEGVPASIEWPGRPDGSAPVVADGPALVSATARTVSITAENVTLGTRVVIALGTVLGLLLWAVPAIVVQVLTRQSLRSSPFAPRVVRALVWGSVGLLVFGTTSELLQQIGRNLLAREVLAPEDSGEILTSLGYLQLTLPLWPACAALALAALAAVFRYGSMLQRRTEALQRETEGLV